MNNPVLQISIIFLTSRNGCQALVEALVSKTTPGLEKHELTLKSSQKTIKTKKLRLKMTKDEF